MVQSRLVLGLALALSMAGCSDDPSEGSGVGGSSGFGGAVGGQNATAGAAGVGQDGGAGQGGGSTSTLEITFEDLALPETPEIYQHLGFAAEPAVAITGSYASGFGVFDNSYDPTWPTWSGFAFSCDTDTVTAGYTNQFSAIPGSGADASSYFALGTPPFVTDGTIPTVTVSFTEASSLTGMYVTNTTYAYLAMRDGDTYAKKFGGASGTDPDWFRLDISGVRADGSLTEPLAFYLADFRSDDSTQDYIVDSWQWVDLSPLGSVTGLRLSVTSSDPGTPSYFALDSLRRNP